MRKTSAMLTTKCSQLCQHIVFEVPSIEHAIPRTFHGLDLCHGLIHKDWKVYQDWPKRNFHAVSGFSPSDVTFDMCCRWLGFYSRVLSSDHLTRCVIVYDLALLSGMVTRTFVKLPSGSVGSSTNSHIK